MDTKTVQTVKRVASLVLFMLIFTTLASAQGEKKEVTTTELANLYKKTSFTQTSVHDPSVYWDEASGYYYIYGSHYCGAKSKDLRNWTGIFNYYNTTYDQAFKSNPARKVKRTLNGVTEEVDFPSFDAAAWCSTYHTNHTTNGHTTTADEWVSGDQWAPDLVYNPTMGKWCYYVSLNGDFWASVVVLMTSNSIEGPYTYQGPVVMGGFIGSNNSKDNTNKIAPPSYKGSDLEIVLGTQTSLPSKYNKDSSNGSFWPNCIDPCVFYDEEGELWLAYGSWSGGIFTLEIDRATGKCIHPKTGQTSDGRMIDSYFGTKISGGYGKSGEGPFIEYNADTGYYYLWVTYGSLTSTGGYNMRVGRSKSPLGPFKDPSGKDMVLPTNPNLNAVGLKVMTNYKFSSLARAYMAPGHNSVLRDDDGQWYLINHTRFDDGGEFHEVRVHTMNFNEAGWPVVMPYEYSGETWSDAGFEPSALAGTYEFINHGTGTDGKITTAQKITLNANGTISGAVTGTWRESDDSAAATFTIGNVSYQGFFNPQFDETGTGKKVMTFTAAGNDNQSIWGVQTDTWNGTERNNLFNHIGSGTLVYDENAVADSSGSVYIGDSGLLSNVPYTITNVNSGKVLESVPDDMTDGTGIQQWSKRGNKSGDKNQDFRLTAVGDGYCKITSMVNEDYCVTVRGDSAENGLEIDFRKYTGADNQKWKLIRSGSYFGIVAKSAGDAAGLDVYEWTKDNGAVIKQWEFWGGECQLWKITPTYASVPARAYTIRNLNSGLFIGAEGGNVQQNRAETAWNFKRNDDGTVTISDGDGRCITASDSTDGTALTLESYTGKDNQKFSVWCNADGSYALLSKQTEEKSGFDVFEGSTDAGAKLIQWSYRGSAGQKFILAPAEAPLPTETETTNTVTTTDTTTTTTETTTEAVTTEPAKLRLGDVNCSGTVDVSDAVLLARFTAEDKTAKISEQGMRNADCNQDNKRSSDDTLMILQHVAKLITLPEAE